MYARNIIVIVLSYVSWHFGGRGTPRQCVRRRPRGCCTAAQLQLGQLPLGQRVPRQWSAPQILMRFTDITCPMSTARFLVK